MRHARKQFTDINVVPYIDVMLVLLIIFMVTFPLMHQSVQINLPKGHGDPLTHTPVKPIILSVDRQGAFFLNLGDNPQKPLDKNQAMLYVSARLQYDEEKGVRAPVLVQGDEMANYQHVMNAIALLSEAGATGIGLVTQPSGSSS